MRKEERDFFRLISLSFNAKIAKKDTRIQIALKFTEVLNTQTNLWKFK